MKFAKKKIGELEKCYSIAPLQFHGQNCFLVAAEKQDPCFLFDEDGVYMETVWEGPGGVMTMVQLSGRDGEFLATRRFYSPNDSKEASLVYVRHEEEKGWVVRELTRLPFVHRFDILCTEDSCYLLACTLKSDHEYKDDWRFPGRLYVGELSGDLSRFGEDNPLPLKILKEGLLKNHGYTRCLQDGIQTGIVSCDNGIYQCIPPQKKGEEWKVTLLLETAGSDAVKMDLDGDGVDELFVFSPFHGDTVRVYHEADCGWETVYEHPEKLEMLHAIDSGIFGGKKCIVFGYRKQKRELMCLYYDREEQRYKTEVIDEDCGPANVHVYYSGGEGRILAANREINEIALYSYED